MKLAEFAGKDYVIISINNIKLANEEYCNDCYYLEVTSSVTEIDWSSFDTCTALCKLREYDALDSAIVVDFYLDGEYCMFDCLNASA